jgi:hypothetical protein
MSVENTQLEKQISEAQRLLTEHGYLVFKLTESQSKDAEACFECSERGEDMDCMSCSCNTCILQT